MSKEIRREMKKKLGMLCCCAMAAASFPVLPAWAQETEVQTEAGTEAETEAAMDWAAMMQAFLDSITGDYDYEETEVSFEKDGLTMRGVLSMPVLEEGEKAPVVILSHGFMSSKEEMSSLAKGYAVNGIASVRFDFIGSGESDGEFSNMSALTEVDDLNAILDYVETLEDIDTENIFLSGNSMGGLVTALCGAQREEDIKAMILNFPAFCIPDDVRSGQIQDLEFDPENVPETMQLGNYTIGACYVTDVIDMDPYELACSFSKDVLIFHGDADQIVDLSYSERLQEEYPSAELVVVEGGGHGFFGDPMLDVIEQSVAFVQAHLEAE